MKKEAVQKRKSLKGVIFILTIILILIAALIGYLVTEGTGIIKKKATSEPNENIATVSLNIAQPEQTLPRKGGK